MQENEAHSSDKTVYKDKKLSFVPRIVRGKNKLDIPDKETILGKLPQPKTSLPSSGNSPDPRHEPEIRFPSLYENCKPHGEFFAELKLQDEMVFFSEDDI